MNKNRLCKLIEVFSTQDREGKSKFKYKDIRELENRHNRLLVNLIDRTVSDYKYVLKRDSPPPYAVVGDILLIEEFTGLKWEEIYKEWN